MTGANSLQLHLSRISGVSLGMHARPGPSTRLCKPWPSANHRHDELVARHCAATIHLDDSYYCVLANGLAGRSCKLPKLCVVSALPFTGLKNKQKLTAL